MWHRLRNTEETQRGQDPEHQVGNQENLTFSSILYTRTRSASSSPLVISMNSKVFGCNRRSLACLPAETVWLRKRHDGIVFHLARPLDLNAPCQSGQEKLP